MRVKVVVGSLTVISSQSDFRAIGVLLKRKEKREREKWIDLKMAVASRCPSVVCRSRLLYKLSSHLSLNFVAQYSGADYQRKILIYLDICSVRGISNF